MKLLNRINTVLLQMTYSLLVKSRRAAGQIVTIGCVLFLIGCDTDHSNNDVANSNDDVAPERAQLVKTTPAVSEIERYTPKMEIVFDKPVAQVEVTAVSEIEPHTPKMEIVVNKSGTQVKVTAVSKINPHTQEMELVFDKPGALVEVNAVDADPNPTMSVGAWQSTTVWTLDLSLFEEIHPPTDPFSTGTFLQTQVCFTVSYVDETGIHQEDLDCVRLPFIEGRYIQPQIIEGTVKDGDVDVDIDKLHTFGFTFRFNEKLVGDLEIRPQISGEDPFPEYGEDLCWIVEWSEAGFGESVRLYRRGQKGQRLLPGTVYTIQFDVSNAGGDVLESSRITFTTKA